jgi:hypothetical protein
VEARGRPQLPVLAGEEGDRRVRGDGRHGGLELVQLAILPSLRTVNHDESVLDCERHRCEGRHGGLGRRPVAFQHLNPLGARSFLRQPPKPGPALGDPAVVIAMDQVGRLEDGHLFSGLRR